VLVHISFNWPFLRCCCCCFLTVRTWIGPLGGKQINENVNWEQLAIFFVDRPMTLKLPGNSSITKFSTHWRQIQVCFIWICILLTLLYCMHSTDHILTVNYQNYYWFSTKHLAAIFVLWRPSRNRWKTLKIQDRNEMKEWQIFWKIERSIPNLRQLCWVANL